MAAARTKKMGSEFNVKDLHPLYRIYRHQLLHYVDRSIHLLADDSCLINFESVT